MEGALQGFLVLGDSLASPGKGRKQGSVWTQLLQKQVRKCEGCAEGPTPGGPRPHSPPCRHLVYGRLPRRRGTRCDWSGAGHVVVAVFPGTTIPSMQRARPLGMRGPGQGPALGLGFLLSRPPQIHISLA